MPRTQNHGQAPASRYANQLAVLQPRLTKHRGCSCYDSYRNDSDLQPSWPASAGGVGPQEPYPARTVSCLITCDCSGNRVLSSRSPSLGRCDQDPAAQAVAGDQPRHRFLRFLRAARWPELVGSDWHGVLQRMHDARWQKVTLASIIACSASLLHQCNSISHQDDRVTVPRDPPVMRHQAQRNSQSLGNEHSVKWIAMGRR